jgi:hypothetical protein
VQPISPGWARFEFAPQPSNLTSFSASVPVVAMNNKNSPNAVNVTLTQTPTMITTTLTVPSGVYVCVCVCVCVRGCGCGCVCVPPSPVHRQHMTAFCPLKCIPGCACDLLTRDGAFTHELCAAPSTISGTSARVCLPPPYGVPGSTATHVELDGSAVATEPEGRMLCLTQDVSPGMGVRTISRS